MTWRHLPIRLFHIVFVTVSRSYCTTPPDPFGLRDQDISRLTFHTFYMWSSRKNQSILRLSSQTGSILNRSTLGVSFFRLLQLSSRHLLSRLGALRAVLAIALQRLRVRHDLHDLRDLAVVHGGTHQGQQHREEDQAMSTWPWGHNVLPNILKGWKGWEIVHPWLWLLMFPTKPAFSATFHYWKSYGTYSSGSPGKTFEDVLEPCCSRP